MALRRLAVLLAAVVLALGAGACGDDDDAADQGATTPTAETAPERPPRTPTATTPSGGREAIAVVGTDFEFSPSSIDVRPGSNTFRFRNEGQAPHALEIEGQGIEEASDVIQTGESTELTVDLEPGRYVIYCPVGDHRERGMEGELTVTG